MTRPGRAVGVDQAGRLGAEQGGDTGGAEWRYGGDRAVVAKAPAAPKVLDGERGRLTALTQTAPRDGGWGGRGRGGRGRGAPRRKRQRGAARRRMQAIAPGTAGVRLVRCNLYLHRGSCMQDLIFNVSGVDAGHAPPAERSRVGPLTVTRHLPPPLPSRRDRVIMMSTRASYHHRRFEPQSCPCCLRPRRRHATG